MTKPANSPCGARGADPARVGSRRGKSSKLSLSSPCSDERRCGPPFTIAVHRRLSPSAIVHRRDFGRAKTPSGSSRRDLSLPRSRFARSTSDLHENGFEHSTSPPPIYFFHRWIVMVLRYVVPLATIYLFTF
ncbi:hypothetical protein V6N11_069475 [Hibiscus sabdariffa]|uniref:Uncharacterized protein n=1 Tax=Hibiscus sabdariffa TaxID=183260 RepID=A0ABR2Q2W0_9ROSI